MDVLITGATGFIGSHLCRALSEAGYATRALIRPTSNLVMIEDLNLDLKVGDLMDLASLEAAMQTVEVVIHCGAEVGGWRDRRTMIASHITGTENILKAARACRIDRLLYTSSVAALGVPEPTRPGQEPMPLDERHEWNYAPKAWPYGYAKHCAEQAVLAAVSSGLDAVILNPAAVLGPGDKNLVASAIVYHMGRGLRPPIPPGGLNIVHIDDVVEGYLAALDHGRAGERYILGGANITFEDFLQEIARTIGVAPLRLRLPSGVFIRLAGIIDALGLIVKLPLRGQLLRMVGRYFYYDTAKAQRELGIVAKKSTHEAILTAHTWYRNHTTLMAGQAD